MPRQLGTTLEVDDGTVRFTTASLLCGLAWLPAALLAARVVRGTGAAIMTPTALSIISTSFTQGSERNKALGIWGALGGIGATTAWLIGGPLVDGPAGGGSSSSTPRSGWPRSRCRPCCCATAGPRGRRGTRRRLGRRTDNPAARRLGRAGRRLRPDRVTPPRAAGAAAHLPLPDSGRRGRPDDPDRHRRGRHAVGPTWQCTKARTRSPCWPRATSPLSWPAPCWPGSAWRWRSCSPADRGSQRTSCQNRTRRPMPLPQDPW